MQAPHLLALTAWLFLLVRAAVVMVAQLPVGANVHLMARQFSTPRAPRPQPRVPDGARRVDDAARRRVAVATERILIRRGAR
jgi:hypothetical protein